MANFSVILMTAAPPGQASEAGGAFVKIDGREALLRSVELFVNRENIKQIQLVIDSDAMEEAKRKYGGHLGFTGVKLITGGPRWVDQLAAAAPTIEPECTHVLLHDAARPAVPYSDIDAILRESETKPIVALVAASRTPLVEVDEGGGAMAIHRSERFMHLLTPQVYSREKFNALASSKKEPHASEMTLLKGSPLNIRLGGTGDAGFAKAMLNMMPKPKIKSPTSPFEEAQW